MFSVSVLNPISAIKEKANRKQGTSIYFFNSLISRVCIHFSLLKTQNCYAVISEPLRTRDLMRIAPTKRILSLAIDSLFK